MRSQSFRVPHFGYEAERRRTIEPGPKPSNSGLDSYLRSLSQPQLMALAAQVDAALGMQGGDIRNGMARPVSPTLANYGSEEGTAPPSSVSSVHPSPSTVSPQLNGAQPSESPGRQRPAPSQDDTQEGGRARSGSGQPQQSGGARGTQKAPQRGQADDGESDGADVTGRSQQGSVDKSEEGQAAARQPVPKPRGRDPAGLIFHHTAGRGTAESVRQVLRQRGLGIQYIIDRQGRIHATGRGTGEAAHMRAGQGPGRGLSNRNTVGVEVIAMNDSDILPVQVEAAKRLARQFPNARVFGHGEVNSHKQRTEGATIVQAVRAERSSGRPVQDDSDIGAGTDGGGAGEGSAEVGVRGTPPDISSGASFRNQSFEQNSRTMIDYLTKRHGLTPTQAAGIVGNLAHESGNFRHIQEISPRAGRGGLGLAQWTGPRRVQFESFLRRTGGRADSVKSNLDFLAHELETTEKRSISAVKRTGTLEDATRTFERTFERAGVKAHSKRISLAQRALNAYRNGGKAEKDE